MPKQKTINPETVMLLEYCGWKKCDCGCDLWKDPMYSLTHTVYTIEGARNLQIARDKEARNNPTGDAAVPKVKDLAKVAEPPSQQIPIPSDAIALRAKCFGLAKIRDESEFAASGELLKRIALERSPIEVKANLIVAAAKQTHTLLCAERTAALAPYDEAESHIKAIRKEFRSEHPELDAKTFGAVKGVSSRENWGYEVFDFMALLKAVVEGTISTDYVLPNDKLLGANVKVLKDKLNIPGVRPKRDYGDTVRG